MHVTDKSRLGLDALVAYPCRTYQQSERENAAVWLDKNRWERHKGQDVEAEVSCRSFTPHAPFPCAGDLERYTLYR